MTQRINLLGRESGKTEHMIRSLITTLRGGQDVDVMASGKMETDPKWPARQCAADVLYDRMLKALQADDHLIVEANQKSRRTILVYSSVYGALTFKVSALVQTLGQS